MAATDYEYLADFTALDNGTLTDNQPIGDTGLVFRSPSGGIKKISGGLAANVDNTSGIAYILLPYDLDPVGTDWMFGVEMEHAGDETYTNTCQFLGRKTLPGLSDDSEIVFQSTSGLKWLLNAGYFVGGRSTHYYQTMNASAGLYYGYGGGVAGGLQYAGCIPAAHGYLLTSNTGSGAFPHVDSYQSSAATATNNSETTPSYLRLRGVKFDLKSTTNLVKRLYVRHGGIIPSLSGVGMPAILNISPKIAGVSGQEVYAALHLPTGEPVAVAIHFHPNASSEYQHGFNSTDYALYASLLANGYAIATLRGTSDAGGTTYTNREASDWGSPTPGGTFRDSLITYLRSLFPSLPFFGMATSMGGATMLGRELRVPGTFQAVALMSAVTNLDACYQDTGQTFDDLIDAAYQDLGDWEALKADYDPNLNLRALQSLPVVAFADVDETVIDTGDNSQGYVAAIASKGADAAFTDCDGAGHMGAAVYDLSVKDFFDRFLEGGEGGYTILVEDETPYVAKETSVEIPVTIDRRGGHSAGIDFTLDSPPDGITLETAEGIEADTVILVLSADDTADEGEVEVTLSATDGTLVRTYVLTLTVADLPTATGTDDGLKVDGGTRHRIVASLSEYGNYRPLFSFTADYGTILPSSQGNVCFWEAPAADESIDLEVSITATLTDNPDIAGSVGLLVPKAWVGNATVGRNQYRAFKAVGLSRWG